MPESVKLDRIDINILAHLQRNGRITNVEPPHCTRNVKPLRAPV